MMACTATASRSVKKEIIDKPGNDWLCGGHCFPGST